jgi:hypothetical protein
LFPEEGAQEGANKDPHKSMDKMITDAVAFRAGGKLTRGGRSGHGGWTGYFFTPDLLANIKA